MADEIIDGQGTDTTEVTDATPSSEAVTYESAAENPEILAAFERTFNKGAAESKEADQGEGEEPTAEEPAEEPVAEESEEAAPVAKAPKTAPKPGKEAPAPAPATLDPALLQAARRAKWSDEQIAGLMEANPELAEQTFKTLQGHFNDLSSRYAQFGNLRNMNPQQPAQRQQQAPQQQAPTTPTSQLDALTQQLEEFAANNGTEIVEKFIKPLYAEVIAPFRQMQAVYAQQQQASMAAEVSNVFAGFGKEYNSLYGENGKMNQEQFGSRQMVAQLADQIRSGAFAQGIDMPVSEALDRAHNLFTVNQQQQFTRQKITAQVKKRTNAITARPTQRREREMAGGSKGDAAALSAVEAFWAERGD